MVNKRDAVFPLQRPYRSPAAAIAYFWRDPRVASIEVSQETRVQCNICNKWVYSQHDLPALSHMDRWDLHRKTCLASKRSESEPFSESFDKPSEMEKLFKAERGVRKYDTERALCGWCDKWLYAPELPFNEAVQTWRAHHTRCMESRVDTASKRHRMHIWKASKPRS
ncbi:hypothetical protein DFP72DRAFT_860579 [Ephemerocybe angulata]|uniref:Uncharacterized protein n=1 Tax=Ephemerocybe angulata TaxID=980116 RepID=A0A8H6H8K4_9AGAR|nr:hypothetical protein DFP72DRAFT_860579 [Tulosesus angulatus]